MGDLKIVFLVAEPVTEDRAEVQQWLETEAEDWGDILQPGLEDGHRKLGYKILAGMQRFIGCNLYSNIDMACRLCVELPELQGGGVGGQD